jgi:hypothetical protein
VPRALRRDDIRKSSKNFGLVTGFHHLLFQSHFSE